MTQIYNICIKFRIFFNYTVQRGEKPEIYSFSRTNDKFLWKTDEKP